MFSWVSGILFSTRKKCKYNTALIFAFKIYDCTTYNYWSHLPPTKLLCIKLMTHFHWDFEATHSRLTSVVTQKMLSVRLIFCYPSVLSSWFCESDAQPTLSRQRPVNAGDVALLQASMADLHRLDTLQLIEELNFL